MATTVATEVEPVASTSTGITSTPSSSGQAISLFAIQDNKAGMSGLDKEKINQLLYEASKDTLYFKHEQERDKRIDEQIKKMKSDWSNFTNPLKENSLEMMEKARSNRGYDRQSRDISQIVVHIDMDMFYAAVEMRDNPELRDKPMAVGSMQMVCTSNYIARKFGVRSGMAGFICKKLCPDLVLVPPNMRKYGQVSGKIMSVLRRYDPDLFVMSCDEAYLNLSPYLIETFVKENPHYPGPVLIEDKDTGDKRLIPEIWDSAFQVVDSIRSQILEATQLTASAGIATTSMLAKICSDLNKPNGQYMLRGSSYEHVQEFVKKLDIRKVTGIGMVQEKILKAFNILTVKDLWDRRDVVYLLFKPAAIDFYLRVSLGLGSIHSKNEDEPLRSRGHGCSFRATNDFRWLDSQLMQLCEQLADTLDDYGLKGKIIVLRLEKDSFDSFVRSRRIAFYTSECAVIYQTAKSILKAQLSADSDTKWRAMGVRVTHLNVNAAQPVDEKKQSTLDKFLYKKFIQDKDASINSQDNSFFDSSQEIEYCDEASEVGTVGDELICTFCSKIFKEYDGFEEHVNNCLMGDKLNHSSQTTIQTIEDEEDADEYICTNCDKTFTEYTEFDQHLIVCLEDKFEDEFDEDDDDIIIINQPTPPPPSTPINSVVTKTIDSLEPIISPSITNGNKSLTINPRKSLSKSPDTNYDNQDIPFTQSAPKILKL
ncbi:DNA polymerase kappa-like [Panonychus citri]|uniref:DNA polymerase kappa-like n=1 Tax=Panonychus citri TaxID=50023 RepID=UPI0023078DD6|nr:DNA polymerase kappa-like [Panonychus citri]XP_053200353.1 DNA polymerase kappa-like [Panonychus citri]